MASASAKGWGPCIIYFSLAIIVYFIFRKKESNPNLTAFVIKAVCNQTRYFSKEYSNDVSLRPPVFLRALSSQVQGKRR